jgi:hypothetical protein
MTEKNKGGRPRQGGEVKLAPLNMRTNPQMREMLEESAAAYGRSLTQEVERRLHTTFIFDEYYGGSHTHTLASLIGSTLRAIEEDTGGDWRKDEATWEASKAAVERLLRWKRPKPEPDATLDDLLARASEAQDEHAAAVKALDEFRASLGIFSYRGVAQDQPYVVGTKPGMFGQQVPHVIDPRANLTSEQIQEEARLEAAARDSNTRQTEANAALMAHARPRLTRIEEARAQGEREADDQFKTMGPLVGMV